MLARSPVSSMRVLCLTMIPGGGAMAPALRRLGYEPYHLMTCFQGGHASTHTTAWSEMLNGRRAFDGKLFAAYDSLVGPPATMLYDRILRECPGYTKVVLVVEPEKDRWAAEYDQAAERLAPTLRRIGSSKKFNAAFTNMIDEMVVKGGDLTSPSFTWVDDLHSTESERSSQEGATAMRPRAVALQQFEEGVKIRVPPGRLLVYRYGDGWDPLCAFLEKPIPDEPFPAYDNGVQLLINLVEKVLFVEVVRRWLTRLFGLWTLYMLFPYLGSGTAYFSELFREYSIASGRDAHPEAVAKSAETSLASEIEELPR
ncbi:unnamed protein product [Phytomonas sp. EM1]|nr:unnamed protein product [Phytomonas sp. EM1]|eukprot:CCW65209.1 unnamed protein product [Phytomonas sp. isolate EM1]